MASALLCPVLLAACAGQAADSSAPDSNGSAPRTEAPQTEPEAQAAQASPLCGSHAGAPVDVRHVVVIVMENHSYRDVIGPDGSAAARRAPYINGTLKKRCGLATRAGQCCS
jgi:phospholipase C